MAITLFRCRAGRLTLPEKGLALVSREDGGNLVVWPNRPVWERSELDPDELTGWSFLVASAGHAMLATLPQLRGGCLNYWEAGNWALNDAADPPGRKDPRERRNVHLHLLGRSPTATAPTHRFGEAPVFPRYDERLTWSARFERLSPEECVAIVTETERRLRTHYGVPAADLAPWHPCSRCGYPVADPVE